MSFFVQNQSSYKLQDVADICLANGDTAPALATGGYSQQPFVDIGNTVLNSMLSGGPNGQPFNHKWNRFLIPGFPTISWQQDYFIPNLVTLGWLESCYMIQYQNTSQPKPKMPVEVHKDLMVTYNQNAGGPIKICWIPNNIALTGVWGDTELQTPTGQNNPGPSIQYTNPLTTPNQPINPITQVTDPSGNLWALTTFGTCGTFNPFALNITATSITSNVLTVTCANSVQIGQSVLLAGTAESFLNGQTVTVASVIGSSPNQTAFTAAFTHANFSNASDTGTVSYVPAYPTMASPSIVSTTVIDGTVVWTAINPTGQGMRLSPIPPQTGMVWQINPVGQQRLVRFTTLDQTLGVIPDDYFQYFVDGCLAQCYRRHPDPKVRIRFKDEWTMWEKALSDAVKQGSHEQDDFSFYPSESIMEPAWGAIWLGAANPYMYPWGY